LGLSFGVWQSLLTVWQLDFFGISDYKIQKWAKGNTSFSPLAAVPPLTGEAMRRRGAATARRFASAPLSRSRWPCPAVGGGLRPPLVIYGLLGGGIA